MDNKYIVSRVGIVDLSPLEGFLPERADSLYNEIAVGKVWTTPIVVDNVYGLIMDGHHRFEVAKRLQLKYVPAVLWSYSDVSVRSLRSEQVVSVSQILENMSNSVIYPNKTAKHDFPFELQSDLRINIDELK